MTIIVWWSPSWTPSWISWPIVNKKNGTGHFEILHILLNILTPKNRFWQINWAGRHIKLYYTLPKLCSLCMSSGHSSFKWGVYSVLSSLLCSMYLMFKLVILGRATRNPIFDPIITLQSYAIMQHSERFFQHEWYMAMQLDRARVLRSYVWISGAGAGVGVRCR